LSIIKLGKDNFERFSVIARPTRAFSSSSYGVTGSVPVFARSSTVEKEVEKQTFVDSEFSSNDPESIREVVVASSGSTNVSEGLENYLSAVNATTRSEAKNKKVETIRFETPFVFNSDFLRKSNIKNTLFKYYRVKNSYAHWAFTNYQCLNFFTSSTVPSDSVIIYDNQNAPGERGPYTPDSSFSLECYLNPRYQNEIGLEYKPGTIYHVSSTFALSLCSGSSTDENGRADKFRLMLQLSSSAETAPSSFVSNNFSFMSDDNILTLNKWHHVVVRWSPDYDNGTGSFVVDGVEKGYFNVNAASISPIFDNVTIRDQDALFVGNFYDGANVSPTGISDLLTNPTSPTPARSFDHPLNAEIHECRIWNSYLDDDKVAYYQSNSVGSTIPNDLMFFLPVLFTKESPSRDVFVTPFQTTTQATVDAHNVSMSFGVGGHEINVENFTREFVKGAYPVLYNLTGSEITYNVTAFKEANELLYSTGSFVKRNLTILPCDNGLTKPDYSLLVSGTLTVNPSQDSPLSKFVNDFENLDLSLVTLNNLLPTSSLYPGLIASDSGLPSSLSEEIEGSTPEKLNSSSGAGDVLSIFQRLRDNSSNSVVFFDTSNLFYGSRIHPGSLIISDSNMTGSGGKVKITLKDNGRGGLYRADSDTPHSTWSGVGTVLYDEGIAVTKSPLVFMIGKEQFEIDMRGERKIHTMEISVPCPASMINSSSNPSFMALTASDDPNEKSVGPVIITGINLHDDNLNVVARVALAQPIIKRDEDRYLFRIKMDW